MILVFISSFLNESCFAPLNPSFVIDPTRANDYKEDKMISLDLRIS